MNQPTPLNSDSCKSCGTKDFSAGERQVGQWKFCLTCFEKLMEAPQKIPPPATGVDMLKGAQSTQVPKPAKASFQCFICQAEVLGQPYKTLGEIKFCRNCVDGIAEAPRKKTIQAQAPSPLSSDPKPQATPLLEPEQSEIRPGTLGAKRCTHCHRGLIEPGGYRMIDCEPWCPICVNEVRPEEVSKATSKPTDSEGKQPGITNTPNLSKTESLECESCSRIASNQNLQSVEGFNICHPCVVSDIQSALLVARGRHRKKLEALRREFED
ncbi:MAG: hypothetical protein VYA34_08630 [Myxococcota bacterium]|nr:hypothetical protein [Myxococcota bacterium]